MKKITDKQRLDWLIKDVLFLSPKKNELFVRWTRSRIDAAMKAEAKHEKK